MLQIPQSTSFVSMFKAYLSSDHTTEATGKTIAITISKNGGAFGNPNAGATNATEVSSGWYKVTLDTTDTNTLGPIAIRGAVATIDDVGVLLQVVSATTGGLTNLDAAVTTRMAIYTQPTGFLAATFPSGTVANTTNITAGTITTTANLTTNNDKTGYALTSGERTSVADSLLARDIGSGTNAGSSQERTVRSALRFLRNKWVISGTTLTVNAEDDTTAMWTAAVTATPGANPITANDPT